MDINLTIKPNLQIRAFYLFFIITSMQTGVGILAVPKNIFRHAGQDSWLSILIAFIYMSLVIMAIFAILGQYENADLLGIQIDVFGKFFGKLLGTILTFIFSLYFLSVLLSYIELIQVFIHPTIPSAVISFILLVIIIYSVLGGIRVVIGVMFIFFFLSSWIFFLLYDPIMNMEFTHFLPAFDTSFSDLLRGARETTYTFIGFEVLFFIYPFIDNKQKAKLPVYLGVGFTTFFVFITTVISIGYYSPHDFNKIDWPVLILFKSVSFSFLERFDYLIIIEWIMVVLPLLILYMWIITYGMKRLYRIRQKTSLYIAAIIFFIVSSMIKDVHTIDKLTGIVSQIGFWFVFIYPFILLPIVLLKKKWQTYKQETKP